SKHVFLTTMNLLPIFLILFTEFTFQFNNIFVMSPSMHQNRQHKLPWILEVSLSRYWDSLIDFLDRYVWACTQRIQTGIRKQKGEFVVTFSAIEVGIHLSLLSNLFWILKTTLAVGYRLL
ncbi:hypothetical protein ACJX0J_028375, partial [Zea mays]